MNIKYIWAKIFKKIGGSAIKKTIIHPTSKIEANSQVINSIFGKHSFCGYNCDIINAEIGSFCSIANNVIIGGGMHPIEWVSTSPVFYYGRDSVKAKFSEFQRESPLRTIIGNDVWIGNNTLIKQGVKIGTGVVIGMGSVVTKDVLDYSIVGGVPAKLLKMRFSDDLINKLLISEWWELDEKLLKDLSKNIKNPSEFIDQLELLKSK